MPTMKDFELLIGAWHGDGEVPAQPPMKVASDATIERLGEFIVFRSVGHPAEMPDTITTRPRSSTGVVLTSGSRRHRP